MRDHVAEIVVEYGGLHGGSGGALSESSHKVELILTIALVLTKVLPSESLANEVSKEADSKVVEHVGPQWVTGQLSFIKLD